MDSTPATSIEEKTLINRSLQFADMLNLGGGNQRQDATAGMDSKAERKHITYLAITDFAVPRRPEITTPPILGLTAE